jgi:putative methyltransferase (TIGR04325 family)
MNNNHQNNHSFSKILRSFIPPVINDYIASKKWSFEGSYESFDEALQKCRGYSDTATVSEIKKKFIESRMSRSTKEVFLDPYDQQLLSAFFIVTRLLDKKELKVLDLGGGFGGHYYQVTEAVGSNIKLDWDIVETSTLASEARELNLDDSLKFFDNINHLSNNKYDLILTSGTLQYLPDPVEMFLKLKDINHTYLIINRFPIFEENKDRLTIQTVPKSYYSASFPSWFFAEDKWMSLIELAYNVSFRWMCMSEVYLGMQKIPFQGLLLNKKLS